LFVLDGIAKRANFVPIALPSLFTGLYRRLEETAVCNWTKNEYWDSYSQATTGSTESLSLEPSVRLGG